MGNAVADPGHPHVVVIGAGFAGLAAVEALATAPVDVTLVDSRYYNTFQPLLYQVAVGGLNPGDIAYPVRNIIRRQDNASFCWGEAERIDLDSRRVHLVGGATLPYDYLVVATGARTNFYGVAGAAEHARAIYTLDDALALRRQIFARLEQAASAGSDGSELALVVAGGGPTGVEMAGALAELLETALATTYTTAAGTAGARVVLVEQAPRLLNGFHDKLARYAREELERRGVEVRLGTTVKEVTADSVRLADTGSGEEKLRCAALVWAAGVAASPLGASSGMTLAAGGRIAVDEHLALADHPEVFAAGDVAAGHGSVEGTFLPQLAQAAIQSGRHAGEQIGKLLASSSLVPLAYHDKGIMATVGRRAAVCELPPPTPLRREILLSGTLAWLAWLGLHIYALIGNRNRAAVLMNWAWRYVAWRRGPRVILGG